LVIAPMPFSTGWTRQMSFIPSLLAPANGGGHQIVDPSEPKSTAAMPTRGSRPIALGKHLGAGRLL
jgi:hypothetical protein